jgi:hypothetical protein
MTIWLESSRAVTASTLFARIEFKGKQLYREVETFILFSWATSMLSILLLWGDSGLVDPESPGFMQNLT